MIPEAAVEAAAKALYLDANPDSEAQWFDITFHDQDELMRTATKALEAAAPHMLGYRLPLGHDDNPHRDGDVQPSSHWIVNRDAGWACDGCDWTGATLQEYWDAHGKPDEYKIPF